MVDLTGDNDRLRAVEQTRAELDSVLATVPVYITRIDTEGVIQYINRTYPGVTREQVIGTHLLNWLPPAHRAPMQAAIDAICDGAESNEFVGQGSGPSGPTWYRSRLGPVLREGQVVAITIVGEDISQLKRAEERALQASRLEAIGQVAGAVAHDFNNVLSVMFAELALLQEQADLLSPTTNQSLSVLAQALEQASGLTRDLVNAVHREPAGDKRVELVEGIGALHSMLAVAAGKRVELKLSFALQRATVALAAHELQQVLLNLAVNAREAMRGSGRIEIAVEPLSIGADDEGWLDPGRYCCIRISDNGPGIPQDIRKYVVEPFFTTKQQGTGLGLANCLALARARGGGVAVAASAEGGAEIRVILPLLADEGVAAASPAKQPPSEASLSILLVEDEERTRSSMTRYLRRMGHSVLEARDGQDALEVLARHPEQVQVVVTDLTMPRLDGLGLLGRLREQHPELPALLITGYVDAEQREALDRLGVAALLKPFSPRALMAEVLRLTSTRSPSPDYS